MSLPTYRELVSSSKELGSSSSLGTMTPQRQFSGMTPKEIYNSFINKEKGTLGGGSSANIDLFPGLQQFRDRPAVPSRTMPGSGFDVRARTRGQHQAERAAVTEFRNTSRRLERAGLGEQLQAELESEEPGWGETVTDPLFDFLQIDQFMGAGAVDEYNKSGDVGKAFMQAVSEFAGALGYGDKGEANIFGTPRQLDYAQVLERHTDLFKNIPQEDHWKTAAAGLFLDLALSPTTYFGYGIFKAIKVLRGIDTIPLVASRFTMGARAEARLASSVPGQTFRRNFMPKSLLKGLAEGENAEELSKIMTELVQITDSKAAPVTADEIKMNAAQFLTNLTRKNVSVRQQTTAFRQEVINLTANMNEVERRFFGAALLEQVNTKTGKVTGVGRKLIDGLNIDAGGKEFLETRLVEWADIFEKMAKNEVGVNLLDENMVRSFYAFGVKPVTGRSAKFMDYFAKLLFGKRSGEYLKQTDPGYRLVSETSILSGAHAKSYPNLIARLLDGVATETDVALMAARRGIESIKKVNTKKLYDTVLNDGRFAIKVDASIVKNVHDPMHIAIKEHGMDFFKSPAFNAFDEGADQVYALPKALVEHLNDAQKVMAGEEAFTKFFRTYREALGIWKAYALMSPGYQMRNLYSNIFNNWLAKVSNPSRYFEAFVLEVEDTANLPGAVRSIVENAMGGRKTIDDLKFTLKDGTSVTGRQLKEEALEHGVYDVGQYGVETAIGLEQELLRIGNPNEGLLTRWFKKPKRIPATVLERGLTDWGPKEPRIARVADQIFTASKEGGGDVTKDQAKALAELYDGVASAWAYKHEGKTPDDWYDGFIRAFEPGLPPDFNLKNLPSNVFTQEQKTSPDFFSRLQRYLTGTSDAGDASLIGKAGNKNDEMPANVILRQLLEEARKENGSKNFRLDEFLYTGIEPFLKSLGTGKIDRKVVDAFFSRSYKGQAPGTGRLVVRSVTGQELAEGLGDEAAESLAVSADRLTAGGEGMKLSEQIFVKKNEDGTFFLEGEGSKLSHPAHKLTGGINHDERMLVWDLKDKHLLDPDDMFYFGRTPMGEPHYTTRQKVPNVFATYRTSEFTNAGGKKVLLVQEIQSDWAQGARKVMVFKSGDDFFELSPQVQRNFKPTRMVGGTYGARIPKGEGRPGVSSRIPQPLLPIEGGEQEEKFFRAVSKLFDDGVAEVIETPNGFAVQLNHRPGKRFVDVGGGDPKYQWDKERAAHIYGSQKTEKKAREFFVEQLYKEREAALVPRQPFATNNVWHTIAMKQIIRDAAERGYEEVAWLSDFDAILKVQEWEKFIKGRLTSATAKEEKANREFLAKVGIHGPPVPGSKADDLAFEESVKEYGLKAGTEDVEIPDILMSDLTFKQKMDILREESKYWGTADLANSMKSQLDMAMQTAKVLNGIGRNRGWTHIEKGKVQSLRGTDFHIDQSDMVALADNVATVNASDAAHRSFMDLLYDEKAWQTDPTAAFNNVLGKMKPRDAKPYRIWANKEARKITKEHDVYSLKLNEFTTNDILKEALPLMQKKGGQAIAATTIMRDGSALISAAEGNNISSFVHELAHVVRKGMIEVGDEQTLNRWIFGDKKYKEAVAKDLPLKWGKPQEEKFARAMEEFVREGVTPHGAGRAMEGTFQQLKEGMDDVYQGMEVTGSKFSPNMVEFARRMFGRGVDPDPFDMPTAKAVVEAAGMMKGSDEPVADKLRRLLGNNWATRLNQMFGQKMENNGRMAHFIQKRLDGLDAGSSAASVKRFLFDYTELTPFERDYLKAVIPFYTWSRKNIPLQIEQIIKQPERYARIPKAMNAIENISGDNDMIPKPDYFDEINATRLPWNSNNQPMYLAQDLPFQDLNKMNMKDFLTSASPFLRIWAELLPPEGQNFFLEQPIEKFSGEPNTVDIFGLQEELPWGKKAQHALETLVPPAGKAARFFRKMEKGRAGEQILREFLGVGVISVDVDAVVTGNRYMKREVARRVEKKLKKRIEEFGLEEGLRRSRED